MENKNLVTPVEEPKKRWSFRDINDEVERICSDGVDVIPEVHPESGEIIMAEEPTENVMQVALDELQMMQDEKVINIGKYCMFLDDRDAELDRQIKRLQAWQRQIRGRRKWLTWYTLNEMIRAGIRHVTGSFAMGNFLRIAVRKSPISSDFVKNSDDKPDVHNIDPRFVRTVVEHKVDKTAANKAHRAALKHKEDTGEDHPDLKIQGFTFETENKHLSIG